MKLRFVLVAIGALSLIGCKSDSPTSNNSATFSIDEDQLILDAALDPLNDIEENESVELTAATPVAPSAAAEAHTNCQTDGTSSSAVSSFVDHPIAATKILINGTAQRFYNNATCALDIVGHVVQREHDLAFSSAYRDATLTTDSFDHLTYLNATVGGGEALLKTSSGWELSILGRHDKLIAKNGRKIFDVSTATVTPIIIEGGLERSNRKVTRGQVAVFHNLAQFTTVVTFNDLEWSESCRCPIAGQLDLQRDGRVDLDSRVDFQGCGQVRITNLMGSVRTLNLPRCVGI